MSYFLKNYTESEHTQNQHRCRVPRLVTSALFTAPLPFMSWTHFPVLWYYISNKILSRSHQNSPPGIPFPFPLSCRYKLLFHFTCAGTLKALNRHWKKNYEMEYLMKGGSWALREIKSCWSWGYTKGIFINLITLKNCFLYVFFKQHQILIKTDTAVQAPCSLLLTEAMWYLHMI